MPRREDDDLEIMQGLSVDRDDARYSPKATEQDRATTAGSKGSPVQQAPKSSPIKGLLLGMIILGLLGACGWLVQQTLLLQKQLIETSASLDLARKRIDKLGSEVFAAGTDYTETGNVVDQKIKFFDSEIRKLWDVSNKRNKAAIKKNTTRVENVTAKVNKVSSQSQANQSRLDKSFKQLSNQFLAENTTMRATLEDQSEQLLLIRGELELMLKRIKGLPNDLALRVKNNEEAVEAIDAVRRQLISRMTQLQERVNRIEGSPP